MPDRSDSYRAPLARVHDLGFAHHADACAAAILELLEPVRIAGGRVLEIGCGSGALTRRLLAGGLRVLATDASPAMLELARQACPDAESIERLVLPDDPVPPADAIVSVGHVLSYLADESEIERALAGLAGALAPGGLLALDLLDHEWRTSRLDSLVSGRVTEDWAILHRTIFPSPDRLVREMTVFVRGDDGTWLRDDERHGNVLLDTSQVPRLLATLGVDAEARASFGDEAFPPGLRAIVGRRRG